ncbi:MAG: pilus assembly FimT family protein [Verrucomicrobiales bacterium]
MMMSLIGQPRNKAHTRSGFTLIELILVMTLLMIVMAVTFPSLGNFFRGRNLDSEARRLLALTRYGQSRAVAEGAPMVLWFDAKERSYGLRAMEGYLDLDDKELEYTVRDKTEIEVGNTFARENPLLTTMSLQSSSSLQASRTLPGGLEQIEFTPDGFISERSPSIVTLIEKDYQVSIALNTNRLSYVITTNQEPFSTRRR